MVDRSVQRDKVFALLRDSLEPMDAPMIAKALGIHVTTARFHLNSLIDSGRVQGTSLPTTSVGRPRKGYTPVGAGSMDTLLGALLAQLGDTADARRGHAVIAGRCWADSLTDLPSPRAEVPDPATLVVNTLTRLGFQVSQVTSAFGEHEIRVCNCPLRRLARDTPEIAEGIQLGLIERVLERHAPILASQYRAAVEPDAAGDCGVVLHLSERSGHRASVDI